MALAGREVQLEVSSAVEPASSLGHQFLFIVIPFGRVVAPELTALVRESARTRLALAGIRAVSPALGGERGALPRLHLRIADASVTAWDLLLTRRASASLTLTATMSGAGALTARGAADRFVTYAFARELGAVLEAAVGEALDDLLPPAQSYLAP